MNTQTGKYVLDIESEGGIISYTVDLEVATKEEEEVKGVLSSQPLQVVPEGSNLEIKLTGARSF